MPPLTQTQPEAMEKPKESLAESYAKMFPAKTSVEPEKSMPEKIAGGVGGFFKGIVQNTLNLGQTVAASQLKDDPHFQNYERSQRELQATRDQVFKRVKQKQARGEDASQLIQMLKDTAMSDSRDVYGDLSASLDKTNLQVGAEFAGLALDIASFGSLPGVAKGAVTGQMFKAGAQQAGKAVAQQAPSILRGAAQGAWTGLKYGTGFGAAYGAQRAVAGGETDVGDIATEAGTGAVTGAAVGGALGGVLGGAGGAWQKHKYNAIQKAEATMASPEGWKYNRTPKGAVDDFATTESLRQGFDDVDVKFIKTSSPGDQAAYRKIYKISEQGAADKVFGMKHNRMEVPGAKLNERVQYLATQRKAAGVKVGEAVKNMPNQMADITDDTFRPFMDDLTEAGVALGEGNKLDFSRSQFAWDTGLQKTIQQVYDDIAPNAQGIVTRTPRQIWTTKNKMHNALDLAKKTNTLVGNGERILTKAYGTLDDVLVNTSDDYARAAKTYAETSNAIRDYNALMGKDFKLSDEVANLRAGEVARRLTGHATSRTTAVVNQIDDLAKQLGYKSDESIANQVVFAADILEQPGVFKTAPGSLRGQAGRGVADVVETGVDAARGRYGTLLERGATKAYEKFADINPEAKKRALRMLIGLEKAPVAKPGMMSRLGQKLSSPVKVEPSAGMAIKDVSTQSQKDVMFLERMRVGAKAGEGANEYAKRIGLEKEFRDAFSRESAKMFRGSGQVLPSAIKDVTKNIHPEDVALMHKFIDHARIKAPLREAEFEMAEKLAQKFGISMDKGLAGVANQFEKVLQGKQVPATALTGRPFKAEKPLAMMISERTGAKASLQGVEAIEARLRNFSQSGTKTDGMKLTAGFLQNASQQVRSANVYDKAGNLLSQRESNLALAKKLLTIEPGRIKTFADLVDEIVNKGGKDALKSEGVKIWLKQFRPFFESEGLLGKPNLEPFGMQAAREIMKGKGWVQDKAMTTPGKIFGAGVAASPAAAGIISMLQKTPEAIKDVVKFLSFYPETVEAPTRPAQSRHEPSAPTSAFSLPVKDPGFAAQEAEFFAQSDAEKKKPQSLVKEQEPVFMDAPRLQSNEKVRRPTISSDATPSEPQRVNEIPLTQKDRMILDVLHGMQIPRNFPLPSRQELRGRYKPPISMDIAKKVQESLGEYDKLILTDKSMVKDGVVIDSLRLSGLINTNPGPRSEEVRRLFPEVAALLDSLPTREDKVAAMLMRDNTDELSDEQLYVLLAWVERMERVLRGQGSSTPIHIGDLTQWEFGEVERNPLYVEAYHKILRANAKIPDDLKPLSYFPQT